MIKVMRSLYRHSYPIRARMRLVDAYGAKSHRSMAADNTSAFNCRFINGQPGVWSQHAYGKAIDIDPVENPYVNEDRGSSRRPPEVRTPTPLSGQAAGDDAPTPAMRPCAPLPRSAGAGGGTWNWPKDFQHFSSNGR